MAGLQHTYSLETIATQQYRTTRDLAGNLEGAELHAGRVGIGLSKV